MIQDEIIRLFAMFVEGKEAGSFIAAWF